MKTIENKITDIKDNDKNINYAEICHLCISQTPNGGFDFNTMEKRLRISQILKNSNKKIELEDADFEELRKCVLEHKWGMMHESIMEFVKTIKDCK